MTWGLSPWAHASLGVFNDEGVIDPWARASLGVWASAPIVFLFEGGTVLITTLETLVSLTEVEWATLEASVAHDAHHTTVDAVELTASPIPTVLGAVTDAVSLDVSPESLALAVHITTSQLTVTIEPDPEDPMSSTNTTDVTTFRIKQAETRPMRAQIFEQDDSGDPPTLASKNLSTIDTQSLVFVYRPQGGGTARTVSAGLVQANEGRVRANFEAGGVGAPGLYEGEFRWTDGEGKLNTSPTDGAIIIEVIEEFGKSTLIDEECS